MKEVYRNQMNFGPKSAHNFHWFKQWDQVRSYNYDMEKGPIDVKWFEGAKTNVCYNCVDRHLDVRPNKTAIIWEGNEPGEDKTISFKTFTNRFVNLPMF